MPKILLLSIVLSVIILTGIATLIFNRSDQETVPKSEIETAVNQAKFLYRQRKEMGEGFSNGPCLSNALMPDWVVDIVHKPRISVDDLSENQCPAYIEGKAQHFVELDLEGNLVRAE